MMENDLRLATSRLALRAFRAADAEQFRELARDFEVARMTSDIPHPLSRTDAERWLKPSSGEARFAVELNGELIGGAGYFRRASGSAELGFWLGRAYWGQGFATEAVKAVIAQGFGSGYKAFSSSHFVDNSASRRVLEKCGFEPAGGGTIWSIARNAEVDAHYYWLSRERAEGFIAIPPATSQKVGRLSQIIGIFSGAAQRAPATLKSTRSTETAPK